VEPEIRLWKAVLIQAAEDATENKNNGDQKDAEYHYGWSQTWRCWWVCLNANISHDCVKAAFKRIKEGYEL